MPTSDYRNLIRMPGVKIVVSAEKAYFMLGNETLWEAAQLCHEVLHDAEIPHAVIGGVAVCLHGYQRNTVDLDLLVRADDAKSIRGVLCNAGFDWNEEQVEFRTSSGIPVQFLVAGERAGSDTEVRLPDPADPENTVEIESLPVVSLSKLIESKLACGQGNLRRTHKDFADVVELVITHQLSRSFARFLHKSLRPTFRELVLNARGQSE